MFFCYGLTGGTSLHCRMFLDTPRVCPYIQDFIGVEIHGCKNPWAYDSMGIQKGEEVFMPQSPGSVFGDHFLFYYITIVISLIHFALVEDFKS